MHDSTKATFTEDTDPLTLREREVLVLVADGVSTEEIARQLEITPGTLKVASCGETA